jgi:hypothetical protein
MGTKQLYLEESQVTRSVCFIQNLDSKGRIEAFSDECAPYSPSIFVPVPDYPTKYAMRKGNKSDHLNTLKAKMGEDWAEMEALPASEERTCLLIDLQWFVQKYNNMGCDTFGGLQKIYLDMILRMRPTGCQVVHLYI